MLDNEDLLCAKEMLRDEQGAESIDGTASRVANDMSIARVDAEGTRIGGGQAGVHAGHDGVFLARWKGEVTVLEVFDPLCVCGLDRVGDGGCGVGHGCTVPG